jgi:Zinc carboxypeptidase
MKFRIAFFSLPLLALLPILRGGMAAGAAPENLAPLSDGGRLDLPQVDPAVPSPATFLGEALGTHFTQHERILRYFEVLAETSARVRNVDYGSTYEGRPLRLAVISSPANLARLEELRLAHLRLDNRGLAEDRRQRLVEELPLVVWLAYGVHGNEPSSSEAAMLVAHSLAAATGDLAELLDSTIILLDPAVNPDGRERYLTAYRARRGSAPSADPQAVEHEEPWPGGRENHYLLDLNRDWAWVTQQETRARLALYRAWEPQVYVDFHEMASSALTYFFPPSAEPINALIQPSVVSWLRSFGRVNAATFDSLGWAYFAHEAYDLFYPGYGDSYTSLRGAVGMTYEVAGGGGAGELLRLPDGTMMSLADRTARHATASLATVRAAAANRVRLLTDFAANARSASGPPRTYLWRADQPEANALAELLRTHGVRVDELARPIDLSIRPLAGGAEDRRELPEGTIAVSTLQPLGSLIRALLEAENELPESFVLAQRRRIEENRAAEFYDITAWSLPMAFNLEVWVADGKVPALRSQRALAGALRGDGDLGYLLPPQGLAGYRAAAQLLQRGVNLRIALESFSNGNRDFAAGTLFVPARNNLPNLDVEIAATISAFQVEIQRVATSYSERGISLGSESVIGVRLPSIALVRGAGVSPSSFGSLWHLLDPTLGLEPKPVDTASLAKSDLSRYDTVVLPDGTYDGIDAKAAGNLRSFVESGGVLLAIGGGVAWAQEHDLTGVRSWAPPRRNEEEEPSEAALSPEAAVADRPLDTPGAILATELRRSHPLAAGLRSAPPVLFSGSRILLPSNDPQIDILVARRSDPVLAGFAWPEAEERLAGSLLMSTEKRGKGQVILFAQDPAFRLFWRGTMPLFLNAVLYEPSRHGRKR